MWLFLFFVATSLPWRGHSWWMSHCKKQSHNERCFPHKAISVFGFHAIHVSNVTSGSARQPCERHSGLRMFTFNPTAKIKKKKKKESLCWLTFSGPPKPIKNLSNIQQRAKIWPGVSQFIHCVGANEPKLAAAYGAASQVLTRLHHSSTDMNLLMILQLKMLFFSPDTHYYAIPKSVIHQLYSREDGCGTFNTVMSEDYGRL